MKETINSRLEWNNTTKDWTPDEMMSVIIEAFQSRHSDPKRIEVDIAHACENGS